MVHEMRVRAVRGGASPKVAVRGHLSRDSDTQFVAPTSVGSALARLGHDGCTPWHWLDLIR